MRLDKITIEVPMKREVYSRLKDRAEDMGFDSVQAYIRFWATAETAEINRRGLSAYELGSPKTQALRYFELMLAQAVTGLSVQGYVNYVLSRIRMVKARKLLDRST
jgi:hypothetical protein